LFSAIIGFIFYPEFTFFDKLIEDLVREVEGLGWFGLTWFILKNNVSASFFGFILGVFVGIFPIINSLTNGLLLGYIYQKTSVVAGYESIWLLLPHGIFELPAIFISLGMGLKLGMFVFTGRGNIKREFLRRLKMGFISFIVVVLPLLIVAAVIEGSLIFLGR